MYAQKFSIFLDFAANTATVKKFVVHVYMLVEYDIHNRKTSTPVVSPIFRCIHDYHVYKDAVYTVYGILQLERYEKICD